MLCGAALGAPFGLLILVVATERQLRIALVAVIAFVTFAVPAWCVASGTWGW